MERLWCWVDSGRQNGEKARTLYALFVSVSPVPGRMPHLGPQKIFVNMNKREKS